MRYGCSRAEHACVANPAPGSAPCCAVVMLEILEEMARILRQRANLRMRLSQGMLLSVVRDRIVQLWDHDVDPVFEDGRLDEGLRIIAEHMHLGGDLFRCARSFCLLWTSPVRTRTRAGSAAVARTDTRDGHTHQPCNCHTETETTCCKL